MRRAFCRYPYTRAYSEILSRRSCTRAFTKIVTKVSRIYPDISLPCSLHHYYLGSLAGTNLVLAFLQGHGMCFKSVHHSLHNKSVSLSYALRTLNPRTCVIYIPATQTQNRRTFSLHSANLILVFTILCLVVLILNDFLWS